MRLWQKAILALVLLITLGAGLSRLQLEADILATLPAQLPEVEGLKQLRGAFQGGDELIICLEAPDSDKAKREVASLTSHLAKATHLVKQVRSGDTFDQPESAAALLAWVLQNGPPETLARLKTQLNESNLPQHFAEVLETLASSPDPGVVQRWSYDPLGLLEGIDLQSMGSLQDSGFNTASADGTFRLIFVAPQEKFTSYQPAAKWTGDIRRELEDWQKQSPDRMNLKLHLTGEPAFLAETGQGIEKDMRSTVGITEVLITILFWFMFRRLKPLLWIQLLLALTLLLTLALASLTLGKVSIMSFGFASIVLGIVVDYAVLILQEATDHPQLDASQVRRRAMPGIIAGACTTAVVFLSLLFSGLPGLADLGLLVAIGVIVGLIIMLTFMPILVMKAKVLNSEVAAPLSKPAGHRFALAGTFGLLGAITFVLGVRGLPEYQAGSDALRPAKSSAMESFDLLQQRLGKADQASVPMLLIGTESALHEQAARLRVTLDEARQAEQIKGYTLPAAFLPNTEGQAKNKDTIEWLMQQEVALRAATLNAGFTEESLLLFTNALSVWRRALAQGWPQSVSQSEASDVLRRMIGSTEKGETVLLGSVTLTGQPGTPEGAKLQALQEKLSAFPEVHLTGWESLGNALAKLVRGEITRLTLPLVLLLGIMLAVTFRNWRDMLLSICLLTLGIAALVATMAALGQTWNLASLAALPLLLGTGIDYGIHLMLAMARENNDIAKVRASTGKAVFFSGMTTIIGFSSLMFAGNKGVASLGLACCIGTCWILLLVLWLLPHWRVWLFRCRL
jgi:uncharacterized protein